MSEDFPLALLLDELSEALERNDRDAVRALCEAQHAHDVAELISRLDDEALWDFLSHLEGPERGEIFSHLPLDRQGKLADHFEDREVARLLEHVAPDDRTDVIQQLEPDAAERILVEMAEKPRRETERLREYEPGTAGAVMSTDVVTLTAGLTVEQAIAQLRAQAENKETIYYNYVLDNHGRVAGTVSLRDLILAKPKARLDDLMETELITIRANDPRESAARLIQDYDLIALPVLDDDERLLGIVTVDDVMDVAEEEVTEDFHKLAAVTTLDQPYLKTRIVTLVKKRIGWLALLFFAGLFTVAAMGGFEDQIDNLALLAIFVPLIIATGGNSGFQAATVMTRAIALQEVKPEHFWRVLGRELLGGLMLGLSLSLIAFVMATSVALWSFWGEDSALYYSTHVGIAVSLSVISVVLFGNLMGSILPFALLKMGLDPATGSTPFVATIVDVVGLLLYFTIASWWLRGIMEQLRDVNPDALALLLLA